MHVLILCEDEMLRELLGQTMTQEGLVVTEAAALCDLSMAVTPDVVVVDGIGRDVEALATLNGMDVVFTDGVPPVVLVVGSVSSTDLCGHGHVTFTLRAPFRAESLTQAAIEAQQAHARGLTESGIRVRIPPAVAPSAQAVARARRP